VASWTIPDPSLVVLIGAAGSGKTTVARRHFAPNEIVSSDAIRLRISGDEADQRATRTVFSILHREVTARLAASGLVVVDATNVESGARRALVARSRAAAVPAVALVLALPPEVVSGRNAARAGRVVDQRVIDRHVARLTRDLARDALSAEGFLEIRVIRSAAELDDLVIDRLPLSRA
jgi:protein phosphatase